MNTPQTDSRFLHTDDRPFISIPDTLALLSKGGKNISWTKLSAYSECKMKWFASNYAAAGTSAQEAPERNEVKAVAGSMIQKIVEMYIKNGIYIYLLADIEKWVWENIVALYKLQRYTVADSKKFPLDSRKYCNTPQGKAREHAVLMKHPNADPTVLKNWTPRFFNPEELDFPTEQEFLAHLFETTMKSLRAFHEKFNKFQNLHTEAFIRASFMNTIQMNGGVDFMYDPMGRPMKHNPKAEPSMGFQIWDGKWNVNSHTKVGQLHFYAYIFHLRNGKIPKQIGFFDWQRQQFLPQAFSLASLEKFKNSIYAINTTQKMLKAELEEMKKHNRVALFEISDRLKTKPSESACKFCDIRSICPDFMPTTYGASKEDFPLPRNDLEVSFETAPAPSQAQTSAPEVETPAEPAAKKPSPFL